MQHHSSQWCDLQPQKSWLHGCTGATWEQLLVQKLTRTTIVCNTQKFIFFHVINENMLHTMAPRSHKDALLLFMLCNNGTMCNKDHKFAMDEVASIAANNVANWMCFCAGGLLNLGENDQPTMFQSHSLLHWKKQCHCLCPTRTINGMCWCPIQGRLPVPRYPRLGIRE